MRYFGGKARISKELSKFLNSKLKPDQPFVDLFCGSCNIISKIDNNRQRMANDKHYYLIEMFKECQKDLSWIPESLTREEYYYVKENLDEKPYLSGFVGFGCSFAGRFFEGYAKDNSGRNYCKEAMNSLTKKMNTLNDVSFHNLDYKDAIMPLGSLIYCDIPYSNTKDYSTGKFNHDEFYDWVRENKDKYDIYISEYKHNIPDGFEIVWEKESSTSIRNGNNETIATIEVLIKYI